MNSPNPHTAKIWPSLRHIPLETRARLGQVWKFLCRRPIGKFREHPSNLLSFTWPRGEGSYTGSSVKTQSGKSRHQWPAGGNPNVGFPMGLSPKWVGGGISGRSIVAQKNHDRKIGQYTDVILVVLFPAVVGSGLNWHAPNSTRPILAKCPEQKPTTGGFFWDIVTFWVFLDRPVK